VRQQQREHAPQQYWCSCSEGLVLVHVPSYNAATLLQRSYAVNALAALLLLLLEPLQVLLLLGIVNLDEFLWSFVLEFRFDF
jgi:hypothetical protein